MTGYHPGYRPAASTVPVKSAPVRDEWEHIPASEWTRTAVETPSAVLSAIWDALYVRVYEQRDGLRALERTAYEMDDWRLYRETIIQAERIMAICQWELQQRDEFDKVRES